MQVLARSKEPTRLPARISLRLLGEIEVERNGEQLILPPSRKTRALLAYLVASGRPNRRDRLCSLLWEVPDDPRGALRWSLSKLRRLLDDSDGSFITATRETVAFRSDGAEIDLFGASPASTRGVGCPLDRKAASTRMCLPRRVFRGQ
jgi:DNA-binding SARP family transcriptional activator